MRSLSGGLRGRALSAALLLGTPLAASAGGLEVRLRAPDRLEFSAPRAVEIAIEVRDPQGFFVEGLALALEASVGRLEGLQEQGGGLYRATYHMPDLNQPLAVILAVRPPEGPPSFHVLSLGRRASIPVTASEPGVQVTLRIDGQSFGPALSDEKGQAAIPALVWPGTSMGVVVAEDERGRKSERSFALPIPDYPRLVVFAERLGFAPRDAIPLYIVALDAKGHPASAISLVTRPKVGLAPAALAPGLFRAELVLPALPRPLSLSLGLAGSGPSQRVLLFRPEDRKPARILLSAEPRGLFADGRSEAWISVALENQAREPLAGLVPALSCTSGSLGPPIALGLGRFRARLTAPESGQGEITCEAKAGEARENLWIALEQKRPASLEASAAPRYLHRDGRSVARIDVRLRDQRGQPLPGQVIRVEECPGALGPFLDLGDGRYSATYTAPLQGDPAEQRILLELSAGEGAVRQRLPLWLLPAGAPLPAEPGADDRWEITPAGGL